MQNLRRIKMKKGSKYKIIYGLNYPIGEVEWEYISSNKLLVFLKYMSCLFFYDWVELKEDK